MLPRPAMPRDINDNIATLKRPLAGDETQARDAIKRRSARACLTCRNRKVRCDTTITGSPCTNCRLDNIDCVIIASKRGPKPRSYASSGNFTHDGFSDITYQTQPERDQLPVRNDSQRTYAGPRNDSPQTYAGPSSQQCCHYRRQDEQRHGNQKEETSLGNGLASKNNRSEVNSGSKLASLPNHSFPV